MFCNPYKFICACRDRWIRELLQVDYSLCVCAGRVDVDGSVFEAELGDVIPVVHTSIGGTRIIGRLTAGTHPCSLSLFHVFAAQGLLLLLPLISTMSPFRKH